MLGELECCLACKNWNGIITIVEFVLDVRMNFLMAEQIRVSVEAPRVHRVGTS